MKLLLTSDGLSSKKIRGAFVGLLEKKVQENKILVVHTAKTPKHFTYLDEIGKVFSRSGILLPHITYLDIGKEMPRPSLSDYDAVYVCGGNTYFILDRIRKVGLADPIKRFVKSGGLYIGVSAGSIIAGKNIEIAGWGSEGDPNEIGLKDLKGLGLTDIAVYPHYKNRLNKEVADFRLSVNYPVETLKDGAALLIQNKKIKRIGL